MVIFVLLLEVQPCTEANVVYVRPGVGTWFHPSMYPTLRREANVRPVVIPGTSPLGYCYQIVIRSALVKDNYEV